MIRYNQDFSLIAIESLGSARENMFLNFSSSNIFVLSVSLTVGNKRLFSFSLYSLNKVLAVKAVAI